VTYYEYNRELAEYFTSLFPPAELLSFLESSQAPRPLVIRTNSMKAKRRELAQQLIQKGVNLDPAGEWNKVGLKIIESQVPIGATTEYLAGMYMLQSASSFLPVMALAPKPGERVLDLCAAPGGKTTHIGQLMKNSGVIVANEFKEDRCASIKGNIHRMGLTNVVITNYDGRKISSHLNGFDRALVDAPCSGLGVIWKDPSVKSLRTLKDIKRNAHVQKELLLSAIDVVNARSKTGGFIVYSTCSISVEENEEVVHYALKNRRVKLVETGLQIGEPGLHKFKGKIFHPSLALCKRIYPHVYNMEGFFIAKFKKIDNDVPDMASKPHTGEKREKKSKGKKKEIEIDEDHGGSQEIEEKIEEVQEEDVMIKDIKEMFHRKGKDKKFKKEEGEEEQVEVKKNKGKRKNEKGKNDEIEEKKEKMNIKNSDGNKKKSGNKSGGNLDVLKGSVDQNQAKQKEKVKENQASKSETKTKGKIEEVDLPKKRNSSKDQPKQKKSKLDKS
jgi:ribosomal RNA methyltransferase Nop2